MKDELEDLAFAELYPEARESIIARLAFLREQGRATCRAASSPSCSETLAPGRHRGAGLGPREDRPIRSGARCSARMSASSSSPTSWRSASSSTTVEQCYHALGVLHSRYPVVPGRFKDYISTPKPNDYRSLHTGVIGPERQRIEVQIRTREMHEVAELGVAAHWVYKQARAQHRGPPVPLAARAARHPRACARPAGIPRAHQARDVPGPGVLLHAQGRSDRAAARRDAGRFRLRRPFADRRHLRRRQDQRPAGAAAHRSSATATRSRSSPRKAQTPSPTWERFVVTGKARARIRRFIRTQQRQQYLDLGKAILQKAFRQEGHELTEKALDAVLKTVQLRDASRISTSRSAPATHTGREVVHAVFPPQARRARRQGRAAGAARAARRRRRTRCRSAASFPAWRCISPAAAIRCRATASSASSPPARASPSTPSTARRSRASPTRRSAGSTSPGAARATREHAHVGRIDVTIGNEPGSLGSLDHRDRQASPATSSTSRSPTARRTSSRSWSTSRCRTCATSPTSSRRCARRR